MFSIYELLFGMRFPVRLAFMLRRRVTSEEARSVMRRRFENRANDFLALVREAIYPFPDNPYRKLLDHAGCEYGDLEKRVNEDGLEGALHVLYRNGVFMTVEEFKGRKRLIRGSLSMHVEPAQLHNTALPGHLWLQSSGSRGTQTSVAFDLGYLRDRAVDTRMVLDVCGGGGWRHALWNVPGGSSLFTLLHFSLCGSPFVHWMSPVDAAAAGLHPRYRWSARLLRLGGGLGGSRFPAPCFVPVDEPLSIAQWMKTTLQAGETPHLWTHVSSAARLCEAAHDAGIDLEGARFTIGGEPVTEARLRVIHGVGAKAMPLYASIEASTVGLGCLEPAAPDDLHFLHDLLALIQPGNDESDFGLPPKALLVSSLRSSCPMILLNASMGDQGVLARRDCGCPLDGIGWKIHLHNVRSFEKLTSGGMTFLDVDVIRVLEEVLPARFGGTPIDYQLLEEEDDQGRPRVKLLVHPALGPIDARELTRTFLDAIGNGSGAERIMGLLWRDSDMLVVERRPPLSTATGKILHLHSPSGR